jgi:hypothetical protein
VTCTVFGESTLFKATGADEFEGTGFTDIGGESQSCASGTFVAAIATYRDLGGRQRRVSADSIDGDVLLVVDNVAANFRVEHTAFFFDCIDNCDFSAVTAPNGISPGACDPRGRARP